ncbi:hypothetical protein FHS42_004391 [Streptomyces zagrosensis]|uniref:Uncharacterized protein n=1 Tax=Streptomyces zagrosensis TaxID=1042984 RepID=A0A7W9QE19_9ACTN|nr:hypothetical protein [Streptomyces zagrosensis]
MEKYMIRVWSAPQREPITVTSTSEIAVRWQRE